MKKENEIVELLQKAFKDDDVELLMDLGDILHIIARLNSKLNPLLKEILNK